MLPICLKKEGASEKIPAKTGIILRPVDFKREKEREQTLRTPILGSVFDDIHNLSPCLLEEQKRRLCFNALYREKKHFLAFFLFVFWKWVFPPWSIALQRNEPGASRPPSGTSKLALCLWDINNNTDISLLIQWSTKIKQMNVDCRLHLWKMKIFTRTCVARTQDHVI